MALISIKEYADKHGKARVTVIQKAVRGGFRTAHKIGSQWVIDSDEPYTDSRVKSGKYVGWRKPKEQKSENMNLTPPEKPTE